MSYGRVECICPGERPGYRSFLKKAMARRERRRARKLLPAQYKRFYGWSI